MSGVVGYATNPSADSAGSRRVLSLMLLAFALFSMLAAVPSLQGNLQGADATPMARAAQAEDRAAALSGIRLAFEPNRGQLDPSAGFSVKAGRATVYFTDTAVTNIISRTEGKGAWVIKERFVGSSGTEPRALRRAPGTVSYFRGSPDEWITDIPTHRAIVYRDLWPGIDMIWRGLPGALEYRFVVHPGANPSAIRVATDVSRSVRGLRGAIKQTTVGIRRSGYERARKARRQRELSFQASNPSD